VKALSVAVALLAMAAAAHEGHFTTLPWDVCASSSLGQTCEFEEGGAISRGSCRSMSGALVCVRNKPLERRGPVRPAAVFGLALAAGGVAVFAERRRRTDRPLRA
jgi:hypothetical protein